LEILRPRIEALTRYISVSHSLACRPQSEWKSSFDTNVSGWKARRSTRLEIAEHLETDGGSFKKRSVTSLSQVHRYIMDCAQIIYLGKVRSIGVSNCSEVKLEEILQTAEIVPAVNQVNKMILFLSIYERVLMSPYYSLNSMCIIPNTNLFHT
jgi:hypothetical protein